MTLIWSLHFHSSIQIVKRNKTMSRWLSSKLETDQSRQLEIAGHKAHGLRARHTSAEKAVVKWNLGRLQENSRKKSEKEANQVETRRKISYQKCSGQPHEYLFSSASFVCSARIFLSVYLLFSSLSPYHNDGQWIWYRRVSRVLMDIATLKHLQMLWQVRPRSQVPVAAVLTW